MTGSGLGSSVLLHDEAEPTKRMDASLYLAGNGAAAAAVVAFSRLMS
ncbi:MAG: hypothetical protein KIT48_08980 [Pseudolabrys sp.]|nr:hypothetical protein [Pseudolabrys sp.]